ncbi:unnamed protein product [Brachionus calyciflorus]|uniref:Uncharacterized protein n=1 Tax=Brachionus calyciflorus TaxID=104777 RepID=A0A814QJI1_9BILA|nr:unnamed protein product [Brachionus calyciflorus]
MNKNRFLLFYVFLIQSALYQGQVNTKAIQINARAAPAPSSAGRLQILDNEIPVQINARAAPAPSGPRQLLDN